MTEMHTDLRPSLAPCRCLPKYCDEPAPTRPLVNFSSPTGNTCQNAPSYVRLAEIYGRFDGIVLLVRITLSHLSPPWTRIHHSTNADLIQAKLLCIHTEHHHLDSEEPSSHITQCILHTAWKRQHFCDQITFWVCSLQVFHFLKTHQLAQLLVSLIWLQLGQKVLTLSLIYSEELFHHKCFLNFHSSQFYFTLAFPLNNIVVLLHLLTGQAYLLLDLIAISELSNCSEHWLVYRKPTTLPAPPPPPRHGTRVTCSNYITFFLNLNRLLTSRNSDR